MKFYNYIEMKVLVVGIKVILVYHYKQADVDYLSN